MLLIFILLLSSITFSQLLFVEKIDLKNPQPRIFYEKIKEPSSVIFHTKDQPYSFPIILPLVFEKARIFRQKVSESRLFGPDGSPTTINEIFEDSLFEQKKTGGVKKMTASVGFQSAMKKSNRVIRGLDKNIVNEMNKNKANKGKNVVNNRLNKQNTKDEGEFIDIGESKMDSSSIESKGVELEKAKDESKTLLIKENDSIKVPVKNIPPPLNSKYFKNERVDLDIENKALDSSEMIKVNPKIAEQGHFKTIFDLSNSDLLISLLENTDIYLVYYKKSVRGFEMPESIQPRVISTQTGDRFLLSDGGTPGVKYTGILLKLGDNLFNFAKKMMCDLILSTLDRNHCNLDEMYVIGPDSATPALKKAIPALSHHTVVAFTEEEPQSIDNEFF